MSQYYIPNGNVDSQEDTTSSNRESTSDNSDDFPFKKATASDVFVPELGADAQETTIVASTATLSQDFSSTGTTIINKPSCLGYLLMTHLPDSNPSSLLLVCNWTDERDLSCRRIDNLPGYTQDAGLKLLSTRTPFSPDLALPTGSAAVSTLSRSTTSSATTLNIAESSSWWNVSPETIKWTIKHIPMFICLCFVGPVIYLIWRLLKGKFYRARRAWRDMDLSWASIARRVFGRRDAIPSVAPAEASNDNLISGGITINNAEETGSQLGGGAEATGTVPDPDASGDAHGDIIPESSTGPNTRPKARPGPSSSAGPSAGLHSETSAGSHHVSSTHPVPDVIVTDENAKVIEKTVAVPQNLSGKSPDGPSRSPERSKEKGKRHMSY